MKEKYEDFSEEACGADLRKFWVELMLDEPEFFAKMRTTKPDAATVVEEEV